MSEANRQTIERLYSAFAAGDGDTMAALYSPDAHFSDPVFGELHGSQVGRMWQMLTGRSRDLKVRLVESNPNDSGGTARWTADYSFGPKRRPVHNEVSADFRIVDGLITEHHDDFSFRRWAGQALGTPGALLGWAPFFQARVRARVLSQLERYSSPPV